MTSTNSAHISLHLAVWTVAQDPTYSIAVPIDFFPSQYRPAPPNIGGLFPGNPILYMP